VVFWEHRRWIWFEWIREKKNKKKEFVRWHPCSRMRIFVYRIALRSLNGSLPSRYTSVSRWIVDVSSPCRWSSFLKIRAALCALDLNRKASSPNRNRNPGSSRIRDPTSFGRSPSAVSVMVVLCVQSWLCFIAFPKRLPRFSVLMYCWVSSNACASVMPAALSSL